MRDSFKVCSAYNVKCLEKKKENDMPLPEVSIISPFFCVTQEAGTGLRNGATGSGQHVFTPSQLLASGS